MTTSPPRLFVDGMLDGLARKLRLMGYDCEALGDVPEKFGELKIYLELDHRLFVTASASRAKDFGDLSLLVTAEEPELQLREVYGRLPIDLGRWAFTRCSRDNRLVKQVTFDEVEGELPPKVRELRPSPIHRCPECNQLYWPGTHVEKLRERFGELEQN